MLDEKRVNQSVKYIERERRSMSKTVERKGLQITLRVYYNTTAKGNKWKLWKKMKI